MLISDWSSDWCSSDLVAWGSSRDEAADRLYDAIGRYRIRGVGHNLPFLAATIAMKRFREGRLTTGFIAEEFPDGFSGAVLDPYEEGALCAVAVAFERATAERPARMSGQDRTSVVWGKSVPARVDTGGRRIIKKKKRRDS